MALAEMWEVKASRGGAVIDAGARAAVARCLGLLLADRLIDAERRHGVRS
jgi:hypothetical protein